jgi:hypothetical protein
MCANDRQVGVPPLSVADNCVRYVIVRPSRAKKSSFNVVGQIGEHPSCIGQRGPAFYHKRILKDLNRQDVGQPDGSVGDVDGAQMRLWCRQFQSETHGI